MGEGVAGRGRSSLRKRLRVHNPEQGAGSREQLEGAGSGEQGAIRRTASRVCASELAARHLPVNGQSIAASAVNAEPRLSAANPPHAPPSCTTPQSRALTQNVRDSPHPPVVPATLD